MRMNKNHQKVKLAFFVVVSIATFYLAWLVFQPFLLIVATATVAAIVLAPFHQWLSRVMGNRMRWSSFLATVIAFVGIGLPLALGTLFIVREINTISAIDTRLFASPWWNLLPNDIRSLFTSIDIQTLLMKVAEFVAVNLSAILASTSRFLLMTLLFFVTLYYLLAEREEVYHKMLAMSPLSNKIDNSIIQRLTHTIRAVVLGNVVVGVVQGILASIGFLIFGLPNAFIWGLLTLLAAQIPMLGTGIITIPAAIYLGMIGNTFGAVGLGIWGLILVGTIDNFLKPKLVEGKTDMHPLLILLSMFGGIQLFGPVGLILGPAVLAATLTFFDMYESGLLAGSFKL